MKDRNPLALFLRYRRKGILLDTNLLLLLLVGRSAPDRIKDFKPIRNQGFDLEDFQILVGVVSTFSKVIVTPHILTEVSNHLDKARGPFRSDILDGFATLAQSSVERFINSAELSARNDFKEFGLADVAITEISPETYLVLSVDFRLVGHLQKNNVDAFNFVHLRNLLPSSSN
jgi:hypothetical protein